MQASLTTYHLLRRITMIILLVIALVAGGIGFSAWSQASTPPLSTRLSNWWISFSTELPENLLFLRDRVIFNWRSFLGQAPDHLVPAMTGSSTPPSLSGESIDDWAQSIEQLVAERLRQERVALGLPVSFSEINPPSGSPGLVVVPSTGDPRSDALIRQRIQASFSDQVIVEFDQSGVTGTVQPVFQNFRGNQYLFLLTPLRDR